MFARPIVLRKFWNSRIRLAYISCCFLLCSISLDWIRISLENLENLPRRRKNQNDDNVGDDEESFNDDMDYVLDTLQYMYDLKLGNAEIRPVVEEEKIVRQYWWRCHLKFPAVVISNDWFRNDDLMVYSATYDRRHSSLYPNNHAIQVLAMSFRSIPQKQKIFCNVYDMSRERYVVVEGTVREIWQRAWDPRDFFYIPNLISCPVPEYFKYSLNLTISLTRITACRSQDSAALVRMPPPPPPSPSIQKPKDGIAICVKGLDYLEDMPERLVEWIEMQFMTGADTITVYTYYVPKKMRAVLDFYAAQGSITVIPINLPGKSPNQIYTRSHFIWRNRQQKRRHELIPYNDCLYRHIDSHKYILILDIDEIVVPLKHDNWSTMLEHVVSNFHRKNSQAPTAITSVSVRNVFKFPSNSSSSSNPEIPSYLYMLRNRRKSEMISKPGEYGKAFINTDTVSTVFNHFALHRQRGDVAKTIYVSPDVAVKLHYKAKCPIESSKQCEQLEHVTVEDDTMDRYAERLTQRVTKVLKNLHIIE